MAQADKAVRAAAQMAQQANMVFLDAVLQLSLILCASMLQYVVATVICSCSR